jgi:proline dehydrogenase
VIRRTLLAASRSERIKHAIATAPVSRDVVRRFVAGETTADALRATEELVASGRLVTLDYLGEDTLDRAQADRTRDVYLDVLDLVGQTCAAAPSVQATPAESQSAAAEVSVKLSAIGQALPGDGEKIALDNAREICAAAARAGTTVTLDMEDHTTTDSTLGILSELRRDFPSTGAVLQAYLYRTEVDCADLATAGSRVRLCKGSYNEPAAVAFRERAEIDRAYVRCLKLLMAGSGYPMVATHDPRLIEIARALAIRYERSNDSYEYQMLYGIRPAEQQRLADQGDQVRVYLPFGDEWYGYLVRRLAERPANLALFMRALVSGQ